jgi:leucyl aminopeptidase
MMTMKADMGGGAAVIGGMLAIAGLAPKGISVTGYVGATENMPGAAAMRPGDVLRSYSGETIEVLNTDAEGRLVLADVLSYAVKQGSTHLVDLATLTGAAFVALGGGAALATGKPDNWVQEVVCAADEGLDRCWQMPLYTEYRRQMDSEIADVKNIGNGRGGGALTAAAFLSDFRAEVPWAHLDIAGMAFSEQQIPYAAKGATGFGVGAVTALALHLAGD